MLQIENYILIGQNYLCLMGFKYQYINKDTVIHWQIKQRLIQLIFGVSSVADYTQLLFEVNYIFRVYYPLTFR